MSNEMIMIKRILGNLLSVEALTKAKPVEYFDAGASSSALWHMSYFDLPDIGSEVFLMVFLVPLLIHFEVGKLGK